MSRLAAGHPTDGELLRFADGETSALESRKIRRHLTACWKCRTELAEIQKTIGECMDYRQNVLPASLPEPPAPWFDIYRRFEALDETLNQRSWAARVWETLQTSVAHPRRWSVAAALVLIVVIVVDQLRNASSVRAAELLERAAATEELRSETPRRIEFRTDGNRVTRVVGDGSSPVTAAALSPEDEQTLAALRPLFERADYSWEDPLSAASFAAWRATLPKKRDEVMTVRNRRLPGERCFQVRTTTDASELVEATLELTADSLQAIEGTLRFRDSRWVEMRDLGEIEIPLPAAQTELPAPVRVPARETLPAEPPAETVEPATPAEELQVLAVLRRLGADLGEPVEVRRTQDRVLVSGIGVTPELGTQIESELAGMPRVAVEFVEPKPGPAASSGAVVRSVTPRTEASEIQSLLEHQLGGRAAYEQFTDEALTVVDELMARSHALRRLAEHFPQETESQLAHEDRQLLSSLRREHAVVIAGLAVTLEERSRPVLRSLGAREAAQSPADTPVAPNWQLATESLFEQARRSESLVAAMLGGAATDVPPEELPTAALSSLAKLRAAAAEFVRSALE